MALASLAEYPNFILLLSDDQNWDGLSIPMDPELPASKNRYVETPSIASLAGQGMRFTQAYAPAPVCSPTRASLQTGKSPARLHWTKAAPVVEAGVGFRLIPPATERQLDRKEVTLAELLRSAGYGTAHFGKWHLGGGGPAAHGYDVSDGNTGNVDAAPHQYPNPVDIVGMGDRAADFMKRMTDSDRSFYLQMSYHALHYPQNASAEIIAKYREKMSGRNDKEILQAAMAEHLDKGVGRLVRVVDDLGIRDRTYVLYMSDNGGGGRGRDRLLRGGKGSLWEGGIRVPFIVRGPGIEPGSVCRVPVTGMDIFPTLCRLAGVGDRLPDHLEGGDIRPLLEGKTQPVQRHHDGLLFHFPHYQSAPPQSALRRGTFKVLKDYETNAVKLYNLDEDSREQRDLATLIPEQARAMSADLDAYLAEVGARLPVQNPDFDPAREIDLSETRKGKVDKQPRGKKIKKRAKGNRPAPFLR